MNIFISYSSKSRTVVEALAIDLTALGYNVWYDRKLTGGQDWWAEILNSIRRCQLFLFALTPQSIESHPCRLEYEYAFALNKRILPVMLADINIQVLPSSLTKFQIVDYRQQDKQQAIALSKALISLPGAKPLPKPLPPKPEMPVSPTVRLRDQIDSLSLREDEQRNIVLELKRLLAKASTAEDARLLLRRLHYRSDLKPKFEREVAALLDVPSHRKKSAAPRSSIVSSRCLIGHTEAIFGATFAPDGAKVVTGSADNTIRLWDVLMGQQIQQFNGHTGAVFRVSYAPNGQTVLSGSRDNTVRLWDVATGKELRCFCGHTEAIWGVAYSPDGKYILSGSFDKTARLWDISTGKEIRSFIGHTGAIWGVAYSPDGKTILTNSWDKTVRLWDAGTGKELRQFIGNNSHVVNVKYSPDGNTALTSARDTSARLWDVVKGEQLHEFSGHKAFGINYSYDGRFVVTGGEDHTICIWNTLSGERLHRLYGHAEPITSVAFSPDGNMLLSGSIDKTARLWEISKLSQKRSRSITKTQVIS